MSLWEKELDKVLKVALYYVFRLSNQLGLAHGLQ